MINVSETLKKIMKEYGLNQTQLSRAVNCDYSTISKYISETRKPDIETLGYILSPFGYELNVELVEKVGKVKSKSFYIEKTYQQLKSMSQDELVDYIFVTQDEEVLAGICGVTKDILEYMPLEKQKELITKKLYYMSALEIYFRISKMYTGIEDYMAEFIEHAKYHLENKSKVPKEILAKAEYLMFDVEVYNATYEDEYFTLYNLRLLDKNRALLDVTSDDIDNYYEETPLDDCLANEIGDYYFDTVNGMNAEIKLNY